MAMRIEEVEKTDADRGAVERGYDDWKRAKIERGLIQARDRSGMIPVEEVLRDLTVER